MEAAANTGGPPPVPKARNDPLTERIKQNLLEKGLNPTPKVIHILRKKHLQKTNRKSKRLAATQPQMTEPQKQLLAEEFYFQTVSREYKDFTNKLESKVKTQMVGRPWERLEREKLKQLRIGGKEYNGERVKSEHLRELGKYFEVRKHEAVGSLLENDIELEDGMKLGEEVNRGDFVPKHRRSDAEAVQILVERLSAREITMRDWKFTRIMKQSKLQFTESQMLKIVGGLGARRCWRQAMDVVQWVYGKNEYKHHKSRFVYTKLLAVLGKAGRSKEALQIFKLMRGDCHIYPDMAAYHSISVTLGQAGLLRELIKVIECMKNKPSKGIKNMRRRSWDPILQPDIVIFNSVLNACVPCHQWKGVSWVFQQLRKAGLRPNGATYGLAMEAMLHSKKYGLVHQLFEKTRRSGEAPKAMTYKILVRTFWEEGKIDDAIGAVRDMEQRGVVGTASVYYELARCLCNNGRWQEAIKEIEKLNRLPRSRPLEVAFTGMIFSCMDGGHNNDCISIFEYMKEHCSPNIGTVNAMLEVYGRSDMFVEAKLLFENTKCSEPTCGYHVEKGDTSLIRDEYTYGAMLKASARAQQWEYFENVYKEMALSGCQFDHVKYAPLFMKASRAGKFHLLEHLVDKTLDCGDIPHPSLFAEMVCEATSHHNYERAVKIVNTMAYAPFEINVEEWTDVFQKNRDRVAIDLLKSLLDTLHNCCASNEATVCNLISSLQSLCGSVSSHGSLVATSPVAKNPSDTVNYEALSGAAVANKPEAGTDNIQDLGFDSQSNDTTIDVISGGELEEEEDDFDWTTYVFGHDAGKDCFDNESSHMIPNHEQDNDLQLQSLDGSDYSQVSELPSAEEILKTWEESQSADGGILSYSLGAY